MFTKYITIALLLISTTCSAQTKGWISLFNGKDLNDWKVKINGHPLNDNYQNTFRVEDQVLKVSYDGYKEWNERYGHIFYKKPFSAYVLVVEYRFTGDQIPGGPGWAFRNSGAMLHSQSPESMELNQDFPISLETQFLGGDGKSNRSTLNLCTPGTNVFLNGKLFTPHCVNSTSKTYHGDQWVRAEIVVLGDSLIQHRLEGKTVFEYTKPQIGGGNVANFNASLKMDGQALKEGYISLQSESHPVEFRKVELFDLKKYMNDQAKLEKVLDKILVK
ncbi:DUF1080 domain-containing protein [Daejeonella sp.]|jgi:hypothetical protein|uniref:DUF1080 domain-containing protein n=1 Tax=Daejeonella sp. TaxID=2805397 RepID=UPI0037C02E7D